MIAACTAMLCVAAIVATTACNRQSHADEPMPVRVAERMAYDWLHRLDTALTAYRDERGNSDRTSSDGTRAYADDQDVPTVPSEEPMDGNHAPGEAAANVEDTSGGLQDSTEADREEKASTEAAQEPVPVEAEIENPPDEPPKQTQFPGAEDPEAAPPEERPFMLPESYRQLRECFVDKGWQGRGFDNPTAAIHWLTTAPVTISGVKSIDVADGDYRASRLLFDIRSPDTITLEAHIVLEDEKPRCCYLRKIEPVATDAAIPGSDTPGTEPADAAAEVSASPPPTAASANSD